MLCRKINARKNRTKVFLLLFSFTFTFYTTQSFQVGAPWCSLQVGFTHFEEYELVFLSFPAQNVHRTLRPPFGAPWVRPTGAFGTSIPNSEAHVLIFFCNSFCIPVLFCKRISSCSLRSLFPSDLKNSHQNLKSSSSLFQEYITKKFKQTFSMRDWNNDIGHRFVRLEQDVAAHFLSAVSKPPLVPL